MALQLYYLTSETAPFCGAYSLSQFTRKISTIFNDDSDFDIRLLQPKYGFISERKYVIREVIRLRNIPVNFHDQELLINLKSAFIPESRVQVYFVLYNDFFKPLPELLYKARNGRVYRDNDEKFTLFSKIALEALKFLYWPPEIIVCNDWQTSLVPIMLKKQYQDDEFFKNIKTAFFLHSINEDYRYYSNNAYKAVNLEPESSEDRHDNLKIAMKYADKVFVIDNEKKELMKQLKKNKDLKATFDNCNHVTVNINSNAKRDDWQAAASDIKTALQNI